MSVKPLDGYRALDMAQYVAGPLAGQALRNGATEVITTEPPRGDAAPQIPATAAGKRFADPLSRAENNRELTADRTRTFAGHSVEESLQLSQGTSLMATRITGITDVVDTPVFDENQFVLGSAHKRRPAKSPWTPARTNSCAIGADGWTPEVGDYGRDLAAVVDWIAK
ncbi:hypothetical protein CJ179_36330 [Rhodococcus sp. ACS1]|uniref:CoA transferase n=1 Tax=Rhodococcus sp. ACS1 TaxID=2028570 RepID=UPI000BB11C15|nr:CoA transferase [Rhodococcus sp. ACS1]PBC39493.1 hypothetical protein CJ179_36330 [Rhodococcus sp. ACS1]